VIVSDKLIAEGWMYMFPPRENRATTTAAKKVTQKSMKDRSKKS